MLAARPILARAWRRLTNLPWWLPLVLGAVLALDTCSRPDSRRFRTTAGEWISQLQSEPVTTAHPRPHDYLIRFDESGGVAVTPSWADHTAQREAEAAGAVRLTIFSPWDTYSGFWAITSRAREITVLNDPGWSPEERRAVGRAIDETLADAGFAGGASVRLAAQMFRDGTYTVTDPLPGGYFHNAIAAALALAFLWSCTLGRPWRSWAAMRQAHHLWNDRCPKCGYPTSRYPGSVCPECGRDWSQPAQANLD